jgi:hypothetical protein
MRESHFAIKKILFSFFPSTRFAVTDNHVQQYGEVNQLGGVFVNVSDEKNEVNNKKNEMLKCLFYLSGTTVAKWNANADC